MPNRLAVNGHSSRRSLIRSIEIIVIACKIHLNYRYVVQFNMGVAKQNVHALELATEGMAAATAQRKRIGVSCSTRDWAACRAVGQDRHCRRILIGHARRPSRGGIGCNVWINVEWARTTSPAASPGHPPGVRTNGKAISPTYGAG